MINKNVIDNIENGVVLCLPIKKQNYTLEFFISLLKELSEKYMVGLIDTNSKLGHTDLFLTVMISQTVDSCSSLKGVEYHVKRWVQMYTNTMVIINDVASLFSAKRRDGESINIESKRICSSLQQIALRYNIAIVAFDVEQN